MAITLLPKEIVDKDKNITILIYRSEWEAKFALAKLSLPKTSTIICYDGYCNAIEIPLN